MVRYTQEELDALSDDADWERVDAMTDEDIYRITGEPPITEEEPEGLAAMIMIDGEEINLNLLDDDVRKWFSKQYDNNLEFKAKINEVLRNYINKQSRQQEAAD